MEKLLTTKNTKGTKKIKDTKKIKHESANICVTRNHSLTCIFLFVPFLYYFRAFRG